MKIEGVVTAMISECPFNTATAVVIQGCFQTQMVCVIHILVRLNGCLYNQLTNEYFPTWDRRSRLRVDRNLTAISV